MFFYSTRSGRGMEVKRKKKSNMRVGRRQVTKCHCILWNKISVHRSKTQQRVTGRSEGRFRGSRESWGRGTLEVRFRQAAAFRHVHSKKAWGLCVRCPEKAVNENTTVSETHACCAVGWQPVQAWDLMHSEGQAGYASTWTKCLQGDSFLFMSALLKATLKLHLSTLNFEFMCVSEVCSVYS